MRQFQLLFNQLQICQGALLPPPQSTPCSPLSFLGSIPTRPIFGLGPKKGPPSITKQVVRKKYIAGNWTTSKSQGFFQFIHSNVFVATKWLSHHPIATPGWQIPIDGWNDLKLFNGTRWCTTCNVGRTLKVNSSIFYLVLTVCSMMSRFLGSLGTPKDPK